MPEACFVVREERPADRNAQLTIPLEPALDFDIPVDHPPSGTARANNPLFLAENLEAATGLLNALREIARAHDATPAQVALAWVIRRPNVVAIPGASSVDQLERNCEAADLELTDDEDEWLTRESDDFNPRTGVAAVPAMVAARRARAE